MRVRASVVVAAAVVAAGCGTTVSTSSAPPPAAVSANGGVTPNSTSPSLSTGAGAAGLGSTSADAGLPAAAGGMPAASAPNAGQPASEPTAAPVLTSTVTGTAIPIGFVDVVNNNEYVSSFGVKGADTGDTRAQAKAVIADANANGGILGRKIVPVWAQYNALSQETDDQQYARICATLTQDNHVFAVLAPWNTPLSFATCLAKAHVLYITDGLLEEDEPTFHALAPYLYSGLFSVSRGAVAFATALGEQHFFRPTSRVGIVRFDYPEYKRASDEYLKPTLARYGVKVLAEAAVNRDSTSTLMANINSAVLQFKSMHIDRVIFLTAAGGTALFFMAQAESQDYHPHYGLASPDSPSFLAQNLKATQLSGSMGVGWLPASDVADAQGPPLTVTEKHCLAVQAKHGNAYSGRSGAITALDYCDLMWLFEDAARVAGKQLTTQGWAAAMHSLGTRHASAVTFRTDFLPDQADGANAFRPLAYFDNCSCFRYTGPVQSLH